jgi:hypothetical protein
MVRRYEFIIRTLCLIGKALEKLPTEGTLDEMIIRAKEILKEIY